MRTRPRTRDRCVSRDVLRNVPGGRRENGSDPVGASATARSNDTRVKRSCSLGAKANLDLQVSRLAEASGIPRETVRRKLVGLKRRAALSAISEGA